VLLVWRSRLRCGPVHHDACPRTSAFRAAALAEPSLRGIFMPPLLAKWAALSDADAELLPLMECLMTIATALGGLQALRV
jgi:hypothetical protein